MRRARVRCCPIRRCSWSRSPASPTRKRYAEYGAPLYLLVDRVERRVTLFAEAGRLENTRVDGPHPFGTVLHLPGLFDLDLGTGEL